MRKVICLLLFSFTLQSIGQDYDPCADEDDKEKCYEELSKGEEVVDEANTEEQERSWLGSKIQDGKTAFSNFWSPQGSDIGNTSVAKNVYKNVSCTEWTIRVTANEEGEPVSTKYLANDYNACRKGGSKLKAFELWLIGEEELFKHNMNSRKVDLENNANALQAQGQDPREFLMQGSIDLNEKKAQYHGRLMYEYGIVATAIGAIHRTRWNSLRQQNLEKCGNNAEACDVEDNVNTEMKSTVNSKLLEYGQKALAERAKKNEALRLAAQTRESLNQWLAGADGRANDQFCQENPHLAACQNLQANLVDTNFKPSAGSGQLAGRTLPNLTPDATGGDFGDGSTDIADTFSDFGEDSSSADFSHVGSAKFASGGAGGSGAIGGSGSSASGLSGGPSGSSAEKDEAKKKGIKASTLGNLYKKKKKSRRRGRRIATSKDAKNYLANLLKKNGKNAKKGGIVFKNRKELNRALANDGVRNRKGLNIFKRISRAHQSILLAPKKDLIVYNSP